MSAINDTNNRRISNVLIDFLNRDDRAIFGLFTNLAPETHANLLCETLNVAVFLCNSFCITAPGPVAECALAQEALRRRSDFLTERIIRFPLRESSIDEFLKKKDKQYGGHRDIYRNLFQPASDTFLKNFAGAIVKRETKVGQYIASHWESGPDRDSIWHDVTGTSPINEVNALRLVGQELVSKDSAVNWPNLQSMLTPHWRRSERELRIILQNYYFRAYLEEYNLRIVTSLPFNRSYIEHGDLAYDYEALKEAMSACASWAPLLKMSASSILRLRARFGYFRMRQVFDRIAANTSSSRGVAEIFAAGSIQCRNVIQQTRIVDELGKREVSAIKGVDWSESEIDALEDRWLAICIKVDTIGNEPLTKGGMLQPTATNITVNYMSHNIHVGGNAVINIDSILQDVTQTISSASALDTERKNELNALVVNLQKEIEGIKNSHHPEAVLISNNLKSVVDAATAPPEKRNSKVLELSKKGLLEAADTVVKIAPTLFAAAKLLGDYVTNA